MYNIAIQYSTVGGVTHKANTTSLDTKEESEEALEAIKEMISDPKYKTFYTETQQGWLHLALANICDLLLWIEEEND